MSLMHGCIADVNHKSWFKLLQTKDVSSRIKLCYGDVVHVVDTM